MSEHLAWVRTSIGIMVFGFVVLKFSLFVKQLSLIMGKPNIIQSKGYSSAIGIVLVAVGAITTLLEFVRYKRTEKEITASIYKQKILISKLVDASWFLYSIYAYHQFYITMHNSLTQGRFEPYLNILPG